MSVHSVALRVTSLMLLAGLVCLGGCDKKPGQPGQALARVNGDEITVHQLNDELGRALPRGAAGVDLSAERKQVLEALIDRQILIGEAMRNKLDRQPAVMQALERARAQILAQAYLQSKIASVSKPAKAEIEGYFQAHPDFFSQRKIFEVNQLAVASADFGSDLKAVVDHAQSLDEIVAWLDAHRIESARSQLLRTSSDLPAQMLAKVRGGDKPQLFVLKEAGKTVVLSVAYLKDSPVSLQAAAPEIAQFLFNNKSREAGEAELKRLRSLAKLEYLGTEGAGLAAGKAPAPASSSGSQAKPAADLAGFK